MAHAEIITCIGEGVRNLLLRAIPERADQLTDLLERQRFHYSAHLLDHTVLYPGMKEVLERLHANGWKLGVVTNKPSHYIRPILEGLGVWTLFTGIVGGGDCPRLKPDPAPLHLAATQMGVSLEAADWMIGDHFTDLESARNAGIRGCFCRYGFGELRTSTFSAVIDAPMELLSLLENECSIATT